MHLSANTKTSQFEQAKQAAQRLFKKVNFQGGNLQNYELSSLMQQTYDFLKIPFKPTTSDIKQYQKVLDANGDGSVSLSDLETLAVSYLCGDGILVEGASKGSNSNIAKGFTDLDQFGSGSTFSQSRGTNSYLKDSGLKNNYGMGQYNASDYSASNNYGISALKSNNDYSSSIYLKNNPSSGKLDSSSYSSSSGANLNLNTANNYDYASGASSYAKPTIDKFSSDYSSPDFLKNLKGSESSSGTGSYGGGYDNTLKKYDYSAVDYGSKDFTKPTSNYNKTSYDYDFTSKVKTTTNNDYSTASNYGLSGGIGSSVGSSSYDISSSSSKYGGGTDFNNNLNKNNTYGNYNNANDYSSGLNSNYNAGSYNSIGSSNNNFDYSSNYNYKPSAGNEYGISGSSKYDYSSMGNNDYTSYNHNANTNNNYNINISNNNTDSGNAGTTNYNRNSQYSHHSYQSYQDDTPVQPESRYTAQAQNYLNITRQLFFKHCNPQSETITREKVADLLTETYGALGRNGYHPNEEDVSVWMKLCDTNGDGHVEEAEYEYFVIRALERSGIEVNA